MKKKIHYIEYHRWLSDQYLSVTPCGLRVGGYLQNFISYTFYMDEVTCRKCREALEEKYGREVLEKRHGR